MTTHRLLRAAGFFFALVLFAGFLPWESSSVNAQAPRIRFQIVDDAGAPRAGVRGTLYLVTREAGRSFQSQVDQGFFGSTFFSQPAPEPLATSISGKDGSIDLGEWPSRESSFTLESPENGVLHVKLPGRVAGGSEPDLPTRITLPPPSFIRGKVVDSKGRPVADAVVAGFDMYRTRLYSTFRSEVRTNASGRFALPVMAINDTFVGAHAPGRGSSPAERVEGARMSRVRDFGKDDGSRAKEDLVLKLEPGRRRRFRVTDANGRPLANLPMLAGSPEHLRSSVALSGEDGICVFHDFPGNAPLRLFCQDRKFAVLPQSGDEESPRDFVVHEVEPGSGVVEAEPVPIAPRRTIQGIAIDSLTGNPVVGVLVQTFVFDAFGPEKPVVSDESGRFSLTTIPRGYRFEITGWHLDYGINSGRVIPPPPADRELPRSLEFLRTEGLEEVCVISMRPRDVVKGRVIDHDGQPVAGASVRYVEHIPDMGSLMLDFYPPCTFGTNEKGEFTVTGVSSNFGLAPLQIQAAGFDPRFVNLEIPRRPSRSLEPLTTEGLEVRVHRKTLLEGTCTTPAEVGRAPLMLIFEAQAPEDTGDPRAARRRTIHVPLEPDGRYQAWLPFGGEWTISMGTTEPDPKRRSFPGSVRPASHLMIGESTGRIVIREGRAASHDVTVEATSKAIEEKPGD